MLTGFLLIIVVVLTSTLSGVFGMVGGMLLLWVLLFLMPVTTAIAVQGIVQLVANCSRAYFSRAWMDWRIIGFSTLGLIAAASILAFVRYVPNAAGVSICVGLLPIFIWLPSNWLRLDASRPGHAVLCGFLSGGLNIGVGVAGPVVDIFFIRTEMDRRQIIATKAALQVASHAGKIIYYFSSLAALSSAETFSMAVATPFAIVGSVIGHRILGHLTNSAFRQATLWLVTGVGAIYLVMGLNHIIAP